MNKDDIITENHKYLHKIASILYLKRKKGDFLIFSRTFPFIDKFYRYIILREPLLNLSAFI